MDGVVLVKMHGDVLTVKKIGTKETDVIMEDNRKLEVFDQMLDRYLNCISGYGYASMARSLMSIFDKEEIIQMLANKFPDKDKKVIIREINKAYGIFN